MVKASLVIGGVRIKRGESKDVHLPLSETYTGDPIRMPMRVISARQPGPVVFITAAIHGDEINGTGIIHDFLFGETVELRRGTLILVPVVNVLGFESNERYLPDRRDLNRSFPGNRNGSMASRIAYRLLGDLVDQCDYGLDLHSAASQRTNYPNVRADLSLPAVRQLAMSFGAMLVVDGKGPVGSFRREATKRGCPTIILEAGEPFKIEPGVLQIGVQGIRNVLIALEMLDGEPARPPFQALIRKTRWMRAAVGGILKFHIRPGDFVEAGQPVATNYSILGREQNTLTSPENGIVLGMATMPAVKPGEPICHVAILSPRQLERFRRKMGDDRKDPYRQVRRDLATNLDVSDPLIS